MYKRRNDSEEEDRIKKLENQEIETRSNKKERGKTENKEKKREKKTERVSSAGMHQ